MKLPSWSSQEPSVNSSFRDEYFGCSKHVLYETLYPINKKKQQLKVIALRIIPRFASNIMFLLKTIFSKYSLALVTRSLRMLK